MTQMSLAAVAMDLGPAHEKAAVLGFADHLGVDRGIKAWPAGPAFELGAAFKDRSAAADTHECAGLLGEIVMRPGPLGPVFAGYLIGKIRQLGAPLCIGLNDFLHGVYILCDVCPLSSSAVRFRQVRPR